MIVCHQRKEFQGVRMRITNWFSLMTVIFVFDLKDPFRAYAEVLGKGIFGNLQGDFGGKL